MKTNRFWLLKEKKEDSYIDAIDAFYAKNQRKRNSQESNKKKSVFAGGKP